MTTILWARDQCLLRAMRAVMDFLRRKAIISIRWPAGGSDLSSTTLRQMPHTKIDDFQQQQKIYIYIRFTELGKRCQEIAPLGD